MKTLLLLLVTFFSISSYSQVDRRIGRGQYERTPKNSQKAKVDFTEQSLDFFRKEIAIDGFQEAVIKNLIEDYQKSSKEIVDSESIETPEKRELLGNLNGKFKEKLSEILTPEQFEKYNQLMEPKKKKKK
jgi:hypothetical protein